MEEVADGAMVDAADESVEDWKAKAEHLRESLDLMKKEFEAMEDYWDSKLQVCFEKNCISHTIYIRNPGYE